MLLELTPQMILQSASRFMEKLQIGLVIEGFHGWLEDFQARFEIFLIILPAADGGCVQRFTYRFVRRRADALFLEAFAVVHHLRFPRKTEKFQGAPGLFFQVSHTILVT